MHWYHCLSPNGPEDGGKEICSNDSFLIQRTNSTICDSELKVQTQDTHSVSFPFKWEVQLVEVDCCVSACPYPLSFFSYRKFLFSGKPIPSIMHKIDSSHITKEANLCLGSGPHMKMKAEWMWILDQSKSIQFLTMNFLVSENYFSPLGLLSW